MNEVKVLARAKVNLSLDILGKREDGYHEVEMVMQTVELHDIVTLKRAKNVQVSTDHPLLNIENDNIAYKAAKLLLDTCEVKEGIDIFIHKQIPVAAGLAGGSADAAAVLKGINTIYDLSLKENQLMEIGEKLGSDVPFCIKEGTALATGRGETITPLPSLKETWMVLAKPPLSVSTAFVYNNFHPEQVENRPDTKRLIQAIESGETQRLISLMENVLETVTLKEYPFVSELKDMMQQVGATKAMMSGSGPTVFGMSPNEEQAIVIANKLREKYPDIFVAVTKTYNR